MKRSVRAGFLERAVSNGEAIFSPAVARRVMQYFAASPASAAPQVFPELTEREREILTLIAQGYTNTAIAEQLVLSSKTVRNHVSNIFGKLQVAGRSEAIIRARDAGAGIGEAQRRLRMAPPYVPRPQTVKPAQ
jgi:DNA-binding NarL/FixJ family response regulator